MKNLNMSTSLMGRGYKQPVFIVGLPRSGSTLLHGILCNSGAYFPMPETHFFSLAAFDLPRNNLRKKHRERIQRKLLKKSRIRLDHEIPNCLTTVKGVFEYVADQFNTGGMPTFLEKTPRHVFFYEEIAGYYPDARFICMIREPKNAVSSHLTMSEVRNKSIIRVSMLFNKIAAAISGIKENSNVLVLKFEDLTDRTEMAVKDVCRFLNISFNEHLIENINAPNGIAMEHETWKRRNIEQKKVKRNQPHRWKEVLTGEQADLVSFITKTQALNFGYNCKYNPVRVGNSFLRDIPKLISRRELKRLFSKVHG